MSRKQIIASDGSIWKPQGGSARGFVNQETGERLSRRQFDRRYGNLARQGFTSYEAKAKATPEAVRRARPAINRPTARGRLSHLNPLTEKLSREISMAFPVYFGDLGQFLDDAADYRVDYESLVSQGIKNSKIFAIALRVTAIRNDGQKKTVTVQRLTVPDSLPDYTIFLKKLVDLLYAGDETRTIDFHIVFKQQYIKQSKRKQMMKERSRLSKRRKK